MSDRNLNPRPSQLDKAAFVAAYGEIYEHSPWVAELAWEKGLSATQDTPAGLAEAMGEVLSSAPAERQLEVIRAHPRSEERRVGKECGSRRAPERGEKAARRRAGE